MLKSFILSIIVSILYELIEGKDDRLIGFIGIIIILTLVFYLGFKKDMHLSEKKFYGFLIALATVGILFTIHITNDKLFDYYINIHKFRIYYKPY